MTFKNEIIFIKDLGMLYPTEKSKRKYRYGMYKCPSCGNPYKAMTTNIKLGESTQCRSCASSSSNLKHGDKHSRMYNIWQNMLRRCETETNPNYDNYGGRGISKGTIFNLVRNEINYALV